MNLFNLFLFKGDVASGDDVEEDLWTTWGGWFLQRNISFDENIYFLLRKTLDL